MRPTAREFELMRSFGPAARLRSQNKFAATINYRPVRGAVSKSKGEREREREEFFPLQEPTCCGTPRIYERGKRIELYWIKRGEKLKKKEKK